MKCISEYWASKVFRRVLGKLNVFASIGRVKCFCKYWASNVFRRVLGELNVFANIGRDGV